MKRRRYPGMESWSVLESLIKSPEGDNLMNKPGEFQHTLNTLKKIHPALDFADDYAYIGQLLLDPKKDEEILHLIRDDRKIFPCRGPIVEEIGIHLKLLDFCLDQRWSNDGIRSFIKGEKPRNPCEDIKRMLMEHIELPEERLYDFFMLWTIGTYFFPLFNSYPYVYIGGIKNSGKTKLLTVCQKISFNSAFSGSISTAAIYRLIENCRCSLFLDETEKLSTRRRSADMRTILLSGYKKESKVYRNQKIQDGDWVPRRFEVYGPKMLANIAGLEDVLESRCISIFMIRGINNKITNREVEDGDPRWQQIRDMLYSPVLTYWRQLKEIYSAFKNETALRNRDWELWKPIFSLAKFFGGNSLYKMMRALAEEKAAERQSDNRERPEFVLVEALLSMVIGDNFYSLSNIKGRMLEKFPEWRSWINEKYVGRILRSLRFSEKRHVRTGTQYFLAVSRVRDCARRLGIAVSDEDGDSGEDSEGVEQQSNESQGEEVIT